MSVADDRSTDDVAALLTRLQATIGRPLEEVATGTGHDIAAVQTGRGYGSLDGLAVLHDPQIGPAAYYARDGKVVLATVASVDGSPEDLPDSLGPADAVLRSRAGKRWQHHVHAGAGVAFSTDLAGVGLALVEVFEPCSSEQYLATLYEDPGRFIE